jgi:hypothetical protein
VAKIEFALLENGLDFIFSGLRFVSRAANKSDLKYGVLHLEAGIELVLKSRLEREDWRLLFQKPEDADERRYGIGDFPGICPETCLDRLKKHCGIAFSPSKRQALTAFRKTRNRFEHFKVTDTKEALESSAASALNVLLDFIGDEFADEELGEEERGLIDEIRRSLTEFNQFTGARMRAIEAKLEVERAGYCGIIQCPTCLQEALKPDVEVECIFCGYKDEATSAAELYSSGVTEADNPKVFRCLNCENQTLVDTGAEGGMSPAVEFICFTCGHKWEEGSLKICVFCGEPGDRELFVGDRCAECDQAYLDSQD